MDIEELQKVWNEQKGENMYVINESALMKSINRKKNAASRRINKVEIGLIIINSLCSILLFTDSLDDPHKWDLLGSFMMLGTVIYVLISRLKRKRSENTFDRTMLGELDHAISNTNSIIRFSRLMILGYLIPFSVFYVGKMIDLGAPLEKWLLIFGLYILAFLLITWERKHMHIPRKEQLQKLREKLRD